MTVFFISILVSFLIALLVTPGVIVLSRKMGFVDDVTERDHPANTHKGVIPRAGGLAIYIAILATSLIFLPINQIIAGVLIGGGLIVIMGLLDDYFDLSARIRLLMNILIVSLVILFGLGIPYITNPFGGVIQLDSIVWTFEFLGEQRDFLVLANLFALIWIIAIMNFVSWSSGVDGQMPRFRRNLMFLLGDASIPIYGTRY